MKKLFVPSQSSHWYSVLGAPVHQVEMKSKPGQMRSTNLTDARKLGLLPSVTSIIKDILAKPALTSWLQEQAVLAALTLPRKDGEDDTEFAKRVVSDADSIASQAAAKGTLIHQAIEEYLCRGEKCQDVSVAHLVEPFYAWADENILNVLKCESVLVSPEGYAGRLDLLAEFRVGGICYADFKSRRPSDGKIRSYPEDEIQLSAYRRADFGPSDDKKHEFGCLSIFINSETPDSPTVKTWEPEELQDSEKVFMHLFEIWKTMKGYFPTIK